jgi:hypothetical protein
MSFSINYMFEWKLLMQLTKKEWLFRASILKDCKRIVMIDVKSIKEIINYESLVNLQFKQDINA